MKDADLKYDWPKLVAQQPADIRLTTEERRARATRTVDTFWQAVFGEDDDWPERREQAIEQLAASPPLPMTPERIQALRELLLGSGLYRPESGTH